ncbi:MAG: hypothetical protein JXA20_02595 [Spirochaetes bacterium]|nr:hypothetical protein [Spirochaetota bacterium]
MARKNGIIFSAKTKRRYAALSFLLSLAVTGLGQLYNGSILRGITLFTLRTLCLLLIPFSALARDSGSHIADVCVFSVAAAAATIASPLEALAGSLRRREIPLRHYHRPLVYLCYTVAAAVITAAALFSASRFFTVAESTTGDALPSLDRGEYMLVKTYSPGGFRNGELVLTAAGRTLRVMAQPGSSVTYDGSVFRIDGVPLSFGVLEQDWCWRYPLKLQQYVLDERTDGREYPVAAQLMKGSQDRRYTLTAGQYLLASDNRLKDMVITLIPRGEILGRVEGILLPLSPERILMKPYIER